LNAITPEPIRRHFDLNVMGLLLITKAAVREFPAEGGSVIDISSGAGRSGAPGGSVYSGTKAAVDTITLSLARELGPRNIRVNAVSPGLVWTEGTVAMRDSPIETKIVSETPLAPVGLPEDIAKLDRSTLLMNRPRSAARWSRFGRLTLNGDQHSLLEAYN